MAQKLRVSIIVPVYNVAPYIADCLRSVMHQTYTGSMECLLVDDCGTDDSITIAERMIADYEGPIQFQILHHERNRGLSAARNTGTEAAKGEYLYYLDSDDEITEDCIEKLMGKVAENLNVEMVQGNYCKHLIGGNAKIAMKSIVTPYAETNEEVRRCRFLYWQINTSVWNKLLKRSFVINNMLFCREGIIYEDQLWIFYLMKYLKNASFVHEITYHYKIRPQSISTGSSSRTIGLNWCEIYGDILNHLTPEREIEEFGYYGKRIGANYVRYMHDAPEFKEILQICKDMCKVYGSLSLRLWLAVCTGLGTCRYSRNLLDFISRILHAVKKR